MTSSLKPNVPLSDPRVKLELVLAFIFFFFKFCAHMWVHVYTSLAFLLMFAG